MTGVLGVFDTIGALVDLPCFGRPARLRGASIDDPDRIGEPVAVGLDETPYVRDGPFRVQRWSTQIVDVTCACSTSWRAVTASSHAPGSPARTVEWRARIRWAHRPVAGSAHCSTLASRTGTCSAPLHPAEVRRAEFPWNALSRRRGNPPTLRAGRETILQWRPFSPSSR